MAKKRELGKRTNDGDKTPLQPRSDLNHPPVPNSNVSFQVLSKWRPFHSYLLLSTITILALAPFWRKAFHIDDTLFLFSAKQIVKHPLDPYGFQLVWNKTLDRMSDVTENPPLTCYYEALVGITAGWSERALHSAFLLPAVALVLGTYRLGRRFTQFPLLGALAAFLTPGILVSTTSVMCDAMMLAFWVWAVTLWLEGLEPLKPSYLLASSLLITASALTKYFGAALIPLLFAYSFVRLRRFGMWMLFFLVPVLILIGYEIWTAHLYGRGLITAAMEFSAHQRAFQRGSTLSHALVSLSFAGGCAISVLALVPTLWSRKQILAALLLSSIAALSLTFNWIDIGFRVNGDIVGQFVKAHWVLISAQLVFCILSGLSILAMAVAEIRAHKRDAESWLLVLWVLGTWFFAAFVNWTVNARSVLPLIPAASILMFRRLDGIDTILTSSWASVSAAVGLVLVALLSILVTTADAAWANSMREAANQIYQRTRGEPRMLYFTGHWGFQYYMQELGFTPADEVNTKFEEGDVLIFPSNNTETIAPPRAQFGFVTLAHLEFLKDNFATTMSSWLGAGFYSSDWGPLPYAFGPVPEERYGVFRLVPKRNQSSTQSR